MSLNLLYNTYKKIVIYITRCLGQILIKHFHQNTLQVCSVRVWNNGTDYPIPGYSIKFKYIYVYIIDPTYPSPTK